MALMQTVGEIPVDSEVTEYSTCICGCGRETQRRFHPGCDPAFYQRLRVAAAAGDHEAANLYHFIFKNNRKATYAEQHQRARRWLNAQMVSAAAD